MKTIIGILFCHMLISLPLLAQSEPDGGALSKSSTVGTLISPFTIKMDLPKIEAFLDRIKAERSFKTVNHPVEEVPALDPTPLPRRVSEIFDQIQTAVFGATDVFRLRYGDLGGPGMCLIEDKEIVLSPYWTNLYLSKGKLGESDLAFILAHELSHYLIELYLQFYSEEKTTPTGLPSRQIVCAPRPSRPYDPKTDPLAYIHEFGYQVGLVGTTHAEVDAFALVIMRKLGFSDSQILESQKAALMVNADGSVTIDKPYPRNVSTKTSIEDAFALNSSDKTHYREDWMAFEPLIRAESLLKSIR